MMNCIAVDDEKLVLDLLVDNIKQVPFLNLMGSFRNAMLASEGLHKEKIDLVYLDIQMPGINGLQFVQSLENPPLVIFITAYREYAIEGFNLNAVDYLMKPVSFDRFLKACNRAHEQFNLRQRSTPKEILKDYFFVYVEYHQIKVNIPEILYIEGMKDYVKIFTNTSPKPIITKMSMKAMEEKLEGHSFVRAHKSYIISADKITAIRRDLVCIGKIELPLSENFKPAVEKKLSL